MQANKNAHDHDREVGNSLQPIEVREVTPVRPAQLVNLISGRKNWRVPTEPRKKVVKENADDRQINRR